MLNESLRSNGDAISAPFLIRLPGNATSVPTQAAPGQMPSVSQLATQAQQQAKLQRFAERVADRKVKHPSIVPKKLHRRLGQGNLNVTKATYNVATEIGKLPQQIYDKIKSSI